MEEALQSAESTNTPQIEVDGQIQYNPLLLLREGSEDPHTTEKIALVHNSRAGHHGIERTIELLYRQNEVWRYMREDVKQFIRNCPLPENVVSQGTDCDAKVHHIDAMADATFEH